jgi:hypothetical protein
MSVRSTLDARLLAQFPQRLVLGDAASHDCDDCLAIRDGLRGITWRDVPSEFLQSKADCLPLLTLDAYIAFLPAWLREGIRAPDSEVATMLLVNLKMTVPNQGFSAEQGRLVVEVARAIAVESFWGADDPVHAETLATIETVWGYLPEGK